MMRLFLALRTSSCRRAIRVGLADGEPIEVDFSNTHGGVSRFGSIVRRLDPPLNNKSLWPDFVQYPNLWAHDAAKYDDWEPVDPIDVVLALAEVDDRDEV